MLKLLRSLFSWLVPAGKGKKDQLSPRAILQMLFLLKQGASDGEPKWKRGRIALWMCQAYVDAFLSEDLIF